MPRVDLPQDNSDSDAKRRTAKRSDADRPEGQGRDLDLDLDLELDVADDDAADTLPDGFHQPNAAPPVNPPKAHPNDPRVLEPEPVAQAPGDGPEEAHLDDAPEEIVLDGADADLHRMDPSGETPGPEQGSLEAEDLSAQAAEGIVGDATDPTDEPGSKADKKAKAKAAKEAKKARKAKKGKQAKKGKKGTDEGVDPETDRDDPEASLAEGEAEDEGSDDARAIVTAHRFGLRLGTHKAGNLLSKLKTRFGKEEVVEESGAEEAEKVEAAATRIEPDERYKEVETYPIHPPYAYVRMLFDEDRKDYIYQVLEPLLTKTEQEILEFIEDTLVDNLTVSPEELEDADELEFITERFNDVIFDYSIILHEDEAEEEAIKKKLLYYLRRNFIGHGPIDVVMNDPYIEDISCDGPHVPIFLYHRKYESMRSTVQFGEHDKLDSFVIKMAQRSGKHISIAEPILDATMTDGSRLQSTLGTEVSAGGSTFTIRKFRPDPFTPPDLVLFRTMSAEMLAYLWISVQNGASIMYSGGTASGKTTSLNAILLFIPPNMKIVSIEDTREVNLPHENWIAGITRTGFGPRDQFGRQAGEIDMFQLLKNALRQRPEYIIVGEVRGQEAYSLFQAMATGHAAYGTMHADSVDAVIHRLESDPINIPRSLLEALDIVSVQIQTRVGGKRVRRTKQISEIVGLDPHTREILTNEVFRWMPKDDSFRFSGVSYILERIQDEKGMPAGSMVKELKRRAEIIEWMIRMHIQDYQDVSRVVTGYYKEPELLLGIVRGEIPHDEAPQNMQVLLTKGAKQDDSKLSAAALAAAPGIESDDGAGAPTPIHDTAAHHPTPPPQVTSEPQEGAVEGEEPPAFDEAYDAAAEGSLDEPTMDEPTMDEPTMDEPTMDEPTMDEPTMDKPQKGADREHDLHEDAAQGSDDPQHEERPESRPAEPPRPLQEEASEGWGPSTPVATEKAHDWGGTDALLGSAEAAAREDLEERPAEAETDHEPLKAERPPENAGSADGSEKESSPPAASPEDGDEWLRQVEEKIRARYEELEKAKKAKEAKESETSSAKADGNGGNA